MQKEMEDMRLPIRKHRKVDVLIKVVEIDKNQNCLGARDCPWGDCRLHVGEHTNLTGGITKT